MNAMTASPRRRLVRLLFILCVALIGFTSAQAQGVPTPIALGENRIGEITLENAAPTFALNLSASQTVRIQVFGVTPGFFPSFFVIDQSGFAVQTVTNLTSANSVQVDVALSGPGIYGIRVQSANGQPGQFLISVQPGEAQDPPTPLTYGLVADGTVDLTESVRRYAFAGAPAETLLVSVLSRQPATGATFGLPPVPAQEQINGPTVILRDADTNDTLAQIGPRLSGSRLRIPPGPANYVLEIAHSGNEAAEQFTICIETESGSIRCPGSGPIAQVPTVTPIPQVTATPTFQPVQIPPNGPCQVTSRTGVNINVRSGPSTGFNVVGSLLTNTTLLVIGRLADNTWYQVNANGIIGWVSGSVVIIGGQCAGVPVVAAPTAVVTAVATPTSTLPGATATATSTVTATATATATNTEPAPVATLNFSLPPTFGSTALTSGFNPDPFAVAITAGGPANVSYLGGGCGGYTTSAPSYSVNYTSGAFPALRFYFIGGGDTTMIINTPATSFVCVDDSFNTVDPTIDFNVPLSGRYDIWIATFSEGQSINGTLYVTELLDNNHP